MILLAVMVSLVMGCGAIKRARVAQDLSKLPAGERTVTASEAGLGEGTVLTADRAVEIALKYHPAIVQAQQSFEIAKKQYQDAKSGYLPNANLNAAYRRQTNNVPGQKESNDSSDSYNVNASGDWLLFDFGKREAAVKQADANMRAAELLLKSAQNDVAYQARLSYYGLIKANSLESLAEDTVRQFQVHLDQVKTLFEVGRRIKYDVTKGEVDLDNAQLSLISAQNTVKTARAALNQALGLAEDPGYVVQEPEIKELTFNFDDLWKTAQANAPVLLASRWREKGASAAVDQSIAGLFPSISLDGSYNWQGKDFPLTWNWAIGPSVAWTLFNGFRNVSGIEQSTANLKSFHAQRSQQEQQLYLDLKNAMAQLSDAKEKLSIIDLVVTNAEQNLDLISERYRVGLASSVEVTDAQVALTRAKSDRVQARFNYLSAVALIQHTIGGFEP
jgi:outer membrane protein